MFFFSLFDSSSPFLNGLSLCYLLPWGNRIENITNRILVINIRLNYGVSFPVLKRVEVNGANAEPLYEYLKSEKPGLMGMKRMYVLSFPFPI